MTEYPLSISSFPQANNEHLKTLPQATVYSYVITTISHRNNTFWQRGSGPNMLGSRITLTTCKHMMRSYKSVGEWPGTWIAGFTSVKQTKGKNALVYLMEVGEAYETYDDFWFALSDKDRLIKDATYSPYGDAYRPVGSNPTRYTPPCPDHSRKLVWIQDLTYTGASGRPHALLVGNPERSFVWDKPELYWNQKAGHGKIGRAQPKKTLSILVKEILTDIS